VVPRCARDFGSRLPALRASRREGASSSNPTAPTSRVPLCAQDFGCGLVLPPRCARFRSRPQGASRYQLGFLPEVNWWTS